MPGKIRFNPNSKDPVIALAKQAGLKVKSVMELITEGVFDYELSHLYSILQGRRGITDEADARARKMLKIDGSREHEWNALTYREIPEEWVADVKEFFAQFGIGGLKLLPLMPSELDGTALKDFCIAARVISEDEWIGITRERKANTKPLTEFRENHVARQASGVLLNSWFRRAFQRVVVKGEPGEGKTTALWLYIIQLCQEWRNELEQNASVLNEAFRPVPLFLPLKLIPSDGAGGAALESRALDHTAGMTGLKAGGQERVKEFLRQKVRAQQFMLILDGLDELPTGAANWLKFQLSRLEPNTPIVITTRYHRNLSMIPGPLTILRLVPFRWWLVEQFITGYFQKLNDGTRLANDVRRLLRINPSLRQMAQNPLLLASLCHFKATYEDRALPETRAELLRGTLHSLLARGDGLRNLPERHGRDEEKIGVLSAVAWHFQAADARDMPQTEILDVLRKHLPAIHHDPPANEGGLLEEFVADGVLMRRLGEPYTFLFRRLREYCVADYISTSAIVSGDPSLAAGRLRGRANDWGMEKGGAFRPLNHPSWTDTWPLLAGCLKGNTALLEALLLESEDRCEDILQSRLRLFASCLGESLGANSDQGAWWSDNRPVVERRLEKLLDLIGEEILVTMTTTGWRSCFAQLPLKMAVPRLVGRFQAARLDVRRAGSYALALAEVGGDDASAFLLGIVGNSKAAEELRAYASEGLGLIGDATARDALIATINAINTCRGAFKGKKILRYGCIAGLGCIGDAISRNFLAGLIPKFSRAPEARAQCIRACERLFGPEIEHEFLRFLEMAVKKLAQAQTVQQRETLDESVRICAETLGRIGSPESAFRMLRLLKEPMAEGSRLMLCRSIAESGDLRAREKLYELVQEPGPLSNYAGLALIKAGDQRTLEALLQLASNPQLPESLRETAVEYSREGSSPQIPTFLNERLVGDPSMKVRIAATRSLGYYGGEAAIAFLRNALTLNLAPEMRFEIACALTLNGKSEAEGAVIEVLKDKNETPAKRFLAAHALSRLESASARSALREVCDDQSELKPIRGRCLDVMHEIQQQQGFRPLKQGGWDGP